MTELNIVYPNGRMNIYVENFLDHCGVGKFKGLLKIIKSSYTPPVHIRTLEHYLTNYIANVDTKHIELVNSADKCKSELANKEEILANLIYKRSEVKAKKKKILTYTTYRSQEYKLMCEAEKELTDEINLVRDELITSRNMFKEQISEIKKLERNNKNFKKYLDLLKDV